MAILLTLVQVPPPTLGLFGDNVTELEAVNDELWQAIKALTTNHEAAHAPDEGCFKSTEPRGPVVIEISKLSKVCADAMRQIELVIMNYRTTGENLLNITFDGQRDLPPEFFLTGKTIILRHIREFLEHAATE